MDVELIWASVDMEDGDPSVSDWAALKSIELLVILLDPLITPVSLLLSAGWYVSEPMPDDEDNVLSEPDWGIDDATAVVLASLWPAVVDPSSPVEEREVPANELAAPVPEPAGVEEPMDVEGSKSEVPPTDPEEVAVVACCASQDVVRGKSDTDVLCVSGVFAVADASRIVLLSVAERAVPASVIAAAPVLVVPWGDRSCWALVVAVVAASADEPGVVLLVLCTPDADESIVVEGPAELPTLLLPLLLSTAAGEEVPTTPERSELPRVSDCDTEL